MSEKLIQTAKADVQKALSETYQASGKDYADTLRRVRKNLPHKVRKDIQYLDEVERKTKHPKLRKQIRPDEIKQARNRVLSSTQSADPAREKSRKKFGWASGLVLNLALFGVVFYLILNWIEVI